MITPHFSLALNEGYDTLCWFPGGQLIACTCKINIWIFTSFNALPFRRRLAWRMQRKPVKIIPWSRRHDKARYCDSFFLQWLPAATRQYGYVFGFLHYTHRRCQPRVYGAPLFIFHKGKLKTPWDWWSQNFEVSRNSWSCPPARSRTINALAVGGIKLQQIHSLVASPSWYNAFFHDLFCQPKKIPSFPGL